VIELFGWFGTESDVDYYRIQYSTEIDDSPAGDSWTEVTSYLPNYYFDIKNYTWVSKPNGPVYLKELDEDNLYRIPYRDEEHQYWAYYDRVAILNSTVIADGLCRIRVFGYKLSSDGNSLVESDPVELVVVPGLGDIVLMIDNSRPLGKIVEMGKNGESSRVCSNLDIWQGDRITVLYDAWDENGHLLADRLSLTFGNNCLVDTLPAGAEHSYDSSNGPIWQGGRNHFVQFHMDHYLKEYNPDDEDQGCPKNTMPTCAYQIRLRLTKRTSNGYDLLYNDVITDTKHYTIVRH
jgi:hypothetical protein